MYDHVLVPTDGSERMLDALEHATSLVKQCDATLHTVHIVQTTGVAETLDDEQFEEVIERIERAGEDAIETVVQQAHEDGITDVRTDILRGIPAEEILEYATQHDIDVVVMATTGRTGDERDVVGSVTERVIRSSSVPVFTVNTGRE
jgi:nucleotide-binding universal stress UspA family protein